jgi:hypothetical protein
MTNATLPTDRFEERDFRIGQTLNRAFSVLSRNFLPFFLVNLAAFVINVIAVVPVLLVLFFAMLGAGAATPSLSLLIGAGAIVMVITLILQVLTQAVVLHAAFQDLLGRPVSIGASVRIGLSRFLPLVGIGFAIGVVVLVLVVILLAVEGVVVAAIGSSPIAALLAAIPPVAAGLMLVIMWFVAPPACVVEQLGPLDSISRSSSLTKGHRWPIFAIWFVVILLSLGINWALGIKLQGGLGTVAAFVWGSVFSAFYSIFVAVTYHDLRVAKEGIGTDQIATVFE